jgi:hypothetical protein
VIRQQSPEGFILTLFEALESRPPGGKRMRLNVNSATIGVSAATESGIGAGLAAATSAAAAVLTSALPMGADLDSAQFAAALNAAGAVYVGTAGEHLAHREMFAGAQNIAAATYTVTDAINNTALSL